MRSHGVLTGLARPRALVQRTQFTCSVPCQILEREPLYDFESRYREGSRFLARSILGTMDREGVDFESRTKD